MSNNFKDLGICETVLNKLEELGFLEPTEIQAKAIPVLLEQKSQDFHGQAQTGTGKTLAFGIPLLHRVDSSKNNVQALIVAPTRELAVQIKESLSELAKVCSIKLEAIYGGVSIEAQISSLKRGVHVVIGTPGRINDLISRKDLKLDGVRTVVLDEADIMLDMGFKEEVDQILSFTNKDREIWLFSATVKPGISDLMSNYMKNTKSVSVSKNKVGAANTKQYYCVIPSKFRTQALCRFIDANPDFYGFVFCQTKILASDIAETLGKMGYSSSAIHGDMSQAQRNSVIRKFKERDIAILVATDVAARGIDVADLTHVINFSIPEDHESYVHRIGRTGRAGKEGIAITFIGKNDMRDISSIKRRFNLNIDSTELPSKNDLLTAKMAQASEYIVKLQNSVSKINGMTETITSVLENYSEADLKGIVSAFIYDKFLKRISTSDIPVVPAMQSLEESNLSEVYLNVGSDDGVEREEIIEFIKRFANINESDIKKIRVIKRRTFIEVPKELGSVLTKSLSGKDLGGRKIRASFIEEGQESSSRQSSRPSYSRSSSGSRFGSNRSSGGYRGSGERSSSGGYRSGFGDRDKSSSTGEKSSNYSRRRR